MVLRLRSSEREKERKRELERAYLNSGHRIRQEKYSRYNKLTLATRHKLLQHKYWRLRQEGSGDTVAPSDDTPGVHAVGEIFVGYMPCLRVVGWWLKISL